MTNNQSMNITIDSGAYPEFIDNGSDHNCALSHMINSIDDSHIPSLEQVLILDHVAMLLNILKSTPSRGVNPQNTNHADMDNVDSRNIVARINGLLECYGRYGE